MGLWKQSLACCALAGLLMLGGVRALADKVDYMGCFQQVAFDSVFFTHSAGTSAGMQPDDCLDNCQQQASGAHMAIGLTMTTDSRVACMCSPEGDENLSPDTSLTNKLYYVDEATNAEQGSCLDCAEGNKCGGDDGTIAVYKAKGTPAVYTGVELSFDEAHSDSYTYGVTWYTPFSVKVVLLSSEGDIQCSTDYLLCNSAVPPPFRIVIDFGDGSGRSEWTPDQPINVFQHYYSKPGTYGAAVAVENLNDFTQHVDAISVTVKESILTVDAVGSSLDPIHAEIHCPKTVIVGEFFRCWIDLPKGNDYSFKISLFDTHSGEVDFSSGQIYPPELWSHIAGGPVYSQGPDTQGTKLAADQGVIMPLTYQQWLSNQSSIEVLALEDGVLTVELVEPVCDTTLVWCELTMACEAVCGTSMQKAEENNRWQCKSSEGAAFCSNEQTCEEILECPASYGVVPVAPESPIKYQVLKTLPEVEIVAGKKQHIPLERAVSTVTARRSHVEESTTGAVFVAFRCLNPLTCPTIAYRTTTEEYEPDLFAAIVGNVYTVDSPTDIPRHHALRLVTHEDRLLQFEHRFFCDKPTEKEVRLEGTDFLGEEFGLVDEATSRFVACQHPLMALTDMTVMPDNPRLDTPNDPLTPYTVLEQSSTQEELLDLQSRKDFSAEVWLVSYQEFILDVQISGGSHLSPEWTTDGENKCAITGGAVTPLAPVTADTTADIPCVFPFRYDGIMYYGCRIETPGTNPFPGLTICATRVNNLTTEGVDYTAVTVGVCNEHCHWQPARDNESPGQLTRFETEGTYTFDDMYDKKRTTHLMKKLVYDESGITYDVSLSVQNALSNSVTETDTRRAFMNWTVVVATPIMPEDWSLVYHRFHDAEDLFTFSLQFISVSGEKYPTVPTVQVFPIRGTQTIYNNLEIDVANPLTIYFVKDSFNFTMDPLPDCSDESSLPEGCQKKFILDHLGIEGGYTGANLTFAIPGFKQSGTYGFSVAFSNLVSDVKYDSFKDEAPYDELSLLDPAPKGSGEWISAQVTKFDVNFVEKYGELKEPIDFSLRYTLPADYGSAEFECDYVIDRWYMPSSAYPAFEIAPFAGDAQRVWYQMVNTDPDGYMPPPCVVDLPNRTDDNAFKITHCPNVTEGSYTVQLFAERPLPYTAGALAEERQTVNTPMTTVEVLSRCGPIKIDDGGIIVDAGEDKHFEIRLENAGLRSCVSIDWGDDTDLEYYGNLESCRVRKLSLTEDMVKPLDYNTKLITSTRVYSERGVYTVHAIAYDIRHFYEDELQVTIFRMPCNTPSVWIPLNFTSLEKPELVPTVIKSARHEVQSVSELKCNESVTTYLSWRLYTVELFPDPDSQVGQIEDLTEIELNETSAILALPALSLELGIYKAVFKLEIETFNPDIPVYGEAHTYFKIIQSPLLPVIMEGSATKVNRGWHQLVSLKPEDYSVDPDEPGSKDFVYEWFCRRISPILENYTNVDSESYPIYDAAIAQPIRPPGEATPINPDPGCFGKGPGPLKTTAGRISLNTSSFITYAQQYEITLILKKDTRRAMVRLEIDVGSIPAPVVGVECLNSELSCTPRPDGMMVNPGRRLALLGNCVDECAGDLAYYWALVPPEPDDLKLKYSACSADVVITTPQVATVTATTSTTTTTSFLVDEMETSVRLIGSVYVASSRQLSDQDREDVVTLRMSKNLAKDRPVLLPTRKKRTTEEEEESESETVASIYDTYPIGPALPDGCKYVFGDGSADARTVDSLSIQKTFYELNPDIKKFQIMLNITKTVDNGIRNISSFGVSYLDIIINQPPKYGECVLYKLVVEEGVSSEATATDGRALLDQYSIRCSGWKDVDGHTITKYVFSATKKEEAGSVTSLLYSGPRDQVIVTLPAGLYDINAAVHESAGAFTDASVIEQFNSYVPSEEDYGNFDLAAQIEYLRSVGDSAMVAQMLDADASIRKSACYYDAKCSLGVDLETTSLSDLSDADRAKFEELLKKMAESNTDALIAAQDIPFTSLDQLVQGASVLYSIASSAAESKTTSKTMDMSGREAATQMISKMSEAFGHIMAESPVGDPNDLSAFIESTSGAVMAITKSLNNIIFADSLDDLPPSDVASALSLPYDTDIGEGSDGNIPDDPEEAMRKNVLQLTKYNAMEQINNMIELVDDVGKSVVMNSIAGEEVRTSSPIGVKMIMSRLSYSKTIGKDIDGDGHPDIPLRFEFEDSSSVIQFPLGFCPGDYTDPRNPHINYKCLGEWGFVLKEWETILKAYPDSAKNLNEATKQIDIDVYDVNGDKVEIKDMAQDIEIVIGRLKHKNPQAVTIKDSDIAKVTPAARIEKLKQRGKPPLIYHYFNVSLDSAAVNVQIKGEQINSSKMIVLMSPGKMPTLSSCDFITAARDIPWSGQYLDWFIPMNLIGARKGGFYLAVGAIESEEVLDSIASKRHRKCSDLKLDKSMLTEDFGPTSYELATLSSGCYFIKVGAEKWDASGMSVNNVSAEISACNTSHLTSFATGFLPQPNVIDFEFVFAAASFQDNMTIYLFIILVFTMYVCFMIWATWRDIKEQKVLKAPFMKDNHPEDTYFYEVLVETGPLGSHATTSRVGFVLTGEEGETEAREFTDPDRKLFAKGSIDAFMMSVNRPLGDLKYLRIWQDNSGLSENGSWFLLSVCVFDLQTGVTTKFIADRWLAVDRGDYEDDLTVNATSLDDPQSASYLFKSVGNKKLREDHAWWSVFTKPLRSRYSRKQRVSICMAVLMLTMLTNAMYYGTGSPRISDGLFTYSILAFDAVDITVGIISNLIIFPPVILATMLFKGGAVFKKKKSRFDRAVEEAEKDGRFKRPEYSAQAEYADEIQGYWKPWALFAHIFGWVLVLIFIIAGGGMVFVYGLSFGNDTTYQWIVSMLIAFLSSVLITQPLYVFIQTACISLCCKKAKFYDIHCFGDEENPTIYWDHTNPPPLRPRLKKAGRRRMEPEFRRQLIRRRQQEYEMKTVLRDLIVYLTYIVIIFIISYGNRDPNAFLEKQALAKSVVHGSLNCEILPEDDPNYQTCEEDYVPEPHIDFMKVSDANEWWYWLDKTLKPNVRVQPWYNERQPYGLKGYLNDRVNRLIGYAIIRQVREEIGTCKPAKILRDSIESCTGDGGVEVEDDRDYCLGWKKINVDGITDNCTEMAEFKHTSASDLGSTPISAGTRTYGGGGYVVRMKGYIKDLEAKLQLLKEHNWIDNRTRAVFVEFSVYNAQVNLFGIVTIVAEFVGGGIRPWFRIDPIRLFSNQGSGAIVTLLAEICFVVATFYYVANVIIGIKTEGCRKYLKSTWNAIDLATVLMSIVALGLYVARMFYTRNMTRTFSETKGNSYIRLSEVALIDEYYNYVVSFTVFTSSLKLCKLLSFQRAFLQVAATIRLCFIGLSSFSVEFSVVFMSFTSFFYFVLKNDLENFRDFIRSLENTIAMSIGKFNFEALRSADEMAAWLFFIFSVVVNMILINMFMAIINLAFEEIKDDKDDFQNRFELLDYMKRTVKEWIGIRVAHRVEIKYLDEVENTKEDGLGAAKSVTREFSEKTSQLLKYIEDTYLHGMIGPDGRPLVNKMKQEGEDKKIINFGFDALFMNDEKSDNQ